MASERARSSIMARTTSRSTGGPMPAACERIRARCSSLAAVRRDRRRRERAEAGRDAVRGLVGVGEPLDDCSARRHRVDRRFRERDLGVLPGDGDDVMHAEPAIGDLHHRRLLHTPSPTRRRLGSGQGMQASASQPEPQPRRRLPARIPRLRPRRRQSPRLPTGARRSPSCRRSESGHSSGATQ